MVKFVWKVVLNELQLYILCPFDDKSYGALARVPYDLTSQGKSVQIVCTF